METLIFWIAGTVYLIVLVPAWFTVRKWELLKIVWNKPYVWVIIWPVSVVVAPIFFFGAIGWRLFKSILSSL
jgi:hypothetical protein